MPISFSQFRSTVVQLHVAFIEHRNIHINLFTEQRNIVVDYARITPNWHMHITKKQGETVVACQMLHEDYAGACATLNLEL